MDNINNYGNKRKQSVNNIPINIIRNTYNPSEALEVKDKNNITIFSEPRGN